MVLKLLPMTFYYTDKSVPYSGIVSEVSFCSRWEKIQRPIATLCRGWEALEHSVYMGCFLQIPLLRACQLKRCYKFPREPKGREGRKSVRDREDEGHYNKVF